MEHAPGRKGAERGKKRRQSKLVSDSSFTMNDIFYLFDDSISESLITQYAYDRVGGGHDLHTKLTSQSLNHIPRYRNMFLLLQVSNWEYSPASLVRKLPHFN